MKQIADDFGISEATLSNWLKAADVILGHESGERTRSLDGVGDRGCFA